MRTLINKPKIKRLIAILLIFFSSSAISGELFQAGTLISLMQGVYDGSTEFKQLLKYGDFGLGTTHAAKGEMVVFGQHAYLSNIEGKAIPISSEEKTPFAMVVRFKPDQIFPLEDIDNIKTFEKKIDAVLPSHNWFYAIKVVGMFNITGRTVSPVENKAPLKTWIEKHQRISNLKNISGTLIIFRAPDYFSPITVPGYHIHFISQDKKQVFHLYDLSFKKADVEIETITKYTILLPTSKEFKKANLRPMDISTIASMEKQNNK